MPSLHPLTKDVLVLTLGAGPKSRFTLRRGALEMLLDPRPGVETRRVPLTLGRDAEVGDVTLHRSGRTLQVRIHDPARLFLAKADDARRLLRGELNALHLIDATDDDAAPTSARRPSAEPATAEAPVRARQDAAAPIDTARGQRNESDARRRYEALLREIHTCPVGLTCRPGRGILYPVPPQGHRPPQGPDVLLVGWNPRVTECHHHALPPLAEWQTEAQQGLARLEASDTREARDLRMILPDSHALESERVMRTFLWKWPTRVKTSTGGSAFYAQRCIRDHFEKELDILRPRVLVTFHTEAAEHFAERAQQLHVDVRSPHAAVRRGEALGWTLPHEAWGWPMGLVLLKDAAEGYDRNTLAWARKAVAHLLKEPERDATGG